MYPGPAYFFLPHTFIPMTVNESFLWLFAGTIITGSSLTTFEFRMLQSNQHIVWIRNLVEVFGENNRPVECGALYD